MKKIEKISIVLMVLGMIVLFWMLFKPKILEGHMVTFYVIGAILTIIPMIILLRNLSRSDS